MKYAILIPFYTLSNTYREKHNSTRICQNKILADSDLFDMFTKSIRVLQKPVH